MAKSNQLSADYVVCTIPLPVLASIDTDFSAPVKQAIAGAKYDHAAKVAFESPRFWEAEQIYGGLSFGGPTRARYGIPAVASNRARGIILGAYVAGKPAEAFEALPIAKQIDMARNAVDKLHPGHGADLSAGVAVDWTRFPTILVPGSIGPSPPPTSMLTGCSINLKDVSISAAPISASCQAGRKAPWSPLIARSI